MLRKTTELIIRFKWAVIAFWLVLTASILLFAPNLSDIANNDQASFLPSDSEPSKASKLMQELFHDKGGKSSMVLAVKRDRGLTAQDREYCKSLETFLQANKDKLAIRDISSPFSRKELEGSMLSKDGTTALINITLTTPGYHESTNQAVRSVKSYVHPGIGEGDANAPAVPDGLSINVAGDAGLSQEEHENINKSMDLTVKITIILVSLILIIVYRSPIAPILPLSTIGLSFLISKGIIAAIASQGMKVSSFTETFLIAVLFGAGTDYCLLIISRFREEFADGKKTKDALKDTIPNTGIAIVSSGGTVMVGFFFMIVAKFGLFNSTGPSIAIGVAITLLAVLTLTPALISVLGEHIFWPAHPSKNSKAGKAGSSLWLRVSEAVTAKPGRFIIISLAALLPFIISLKWVNLSYDQIKDIPSSSDAVKGFETMAEAFGQGEMLPVKVVLKTGSNAWSAESLQATERVADNLSRVDNVSKVRTATRPLGEKLTEASVSNQLKQLTGGLSQLESGISTVTGSMNDMQKGIQDIASALSKGGGELGPAAASLTKIAGGMQQSSDALGKVQSGLKDINAAANKYTGGSSPLDDVFYLPEGALDTYPELRKAMENYISPQGDGISFDIILSVPPYTGTALDTISEINRAVKDGIKGTVLEGSEYHVGGATAVFNDIRSVISRDFKIVMTIVLLGIFLVLVFMLRSIIAPLYLIFTILISYATTMGATHLMFQSFMGFDGLHWAVPFFAFCILVALGVDYNIFLMSRVKEEYMPGNMTEGVAKALASTGGIITSCGIIMAGTFGAMMASPIRPLFEIGFAAVVGLLLDTFVIRCLTVPAIAVKVGELNWWPGRKVKILPVEAGEDEKD